MGQIITFYSYKGGVGRSMALANIAALLSRWGYSTLMVDWDLEAPGLEYFFKPYLALDSIATETGVIDYVSDLARAGSSGSLKRTWRDSVVTISIPDSKTPLSLLTAGKRGPDSDFFKRVRAFDMDVFYK